LQIVACIASAYHNGLSITWIWVPAAVAEARTGAGRTA
jgi:hypothetical protein